MADIYDLVIIGLGPAGSFAAKSAINNGLSVLAIDKRNIIGYPVDCGELRDTGSSGSLCLQAKSRYCYN